MKVDVEDISPAHKKVTIEIPVELVNAEIDKYYAGIQKNVKMEGFRAGKVPLQIIKQTYSGSMPHIVKHRLYEKTIHKEFEKHKIEPLDSPVIEGEILERGMPYRFSVLVEVKPDILEDTDLEVERDAVDYIFRWKNCMNKVTRQ